MNGSVRGVWAVSLLLPLLFLSGCSSETVEGSAQHYEFDQGLLTRPRADSAPSMRSSLDRRFLDDGVASDPEATELWIIPRDPAAASSPTGERRWDPLRVVHPRADEPRALPLVGTDCDAEIFGFVASVEVHQRFANPCRRPIEVEYTFPLPHDASVRGFIMEIGERRIRGIIREKEEAKRIYERARRHGHTASLLSEVRPNIFRQRVANIRPGVPIGVRFHYEHMLEYRDGWYVFVHPMAIGPRYNPAGSPDPVHVNNASLGSPTAPVKLSVDLDGGMAVEEVMCPTHHTSITRSDARRLQVRLDPTERIPDRDFVLRFRVETDRLKAGYLVQPQASGGTFAVMLHPPRALQNLERQPIELVLVLDRSGSMKGTPLDQAKQAARTALRYLGPSDTFRVLTFSDDVDHFGRSPRLATDRSITDALRYIDSIEAGGGTRMLGGMREALRGRRDGERARWVCFMTDGFIGNEDEVLGVIHDDLENSRVFSFGIGSSPNRHLMRRMAEVGRGMATFLADDADGGDVMERFLRRSSHPALCDLQLDVRGTRIHDVYPERLPDVFLGAPVTIIGRYDGAPPSALIVRGRAGGRPVALNLTPEQTPARHDSLRTVWARRRLAAISDSAIRRGGFSRSLSEDALATALRHGILSPWTSFVAVDSLARADREPREIPVRVGTPLPRGMPYDARRR